MEQVANLFHAILMEQYALPVRIDDSSCLSSQPIDVNEAFSLLPRRSRSRWKSRCRVYNIGWLCFALALFCRLLANPSEP